jgi:hypothetical protein
MSRASDENLRLRKGQGCAGLLWEQDEHIAWALIDAANVAEEHNLTDEQAAATAHLTIVISCAIYSGRGDGRTLIGVLNLDAPTIDAVESWWDEQQHQVEPRIQDRLRIMAEEISERGYLPM